MLDSSQDVELTNIETTVLSSTSRRNQSSDRRQHIRSAKTEENLQQLPFAKDAPHCVTCCCLPDKMKCRIPCLESCAKQHNLNSGILHYNSNDFLAKIKTPSNTGSTKRHYHDEKKRNSSIHTTVEELLQEMRLSTSILFDDETNEKQSVRIDNELLDRSKNEEDANSIIRQQERRRRKRSSNNLISHHHHHRPTTQHQPFTKLKNPETTQASVRSCERWPENRQHQQQQQEEEEEQQQEEQLQQEQQSINEGRFEEMEIPTIEDLGTDNSHQRDHSSSPEPSYHVKSEWRATRGNSAALLGAGDEANENNVNTNAVDKEYPYSEFEIDELCNNLRSCHNEDDLRELERVRGEFIERILEEMLKLQRLHRHLERCSSHGTRNVCTMTSARSNINS